MCKDIYCNHRWPLHTLHHVVQQLASVGQYICYYEGTGRLWRVTGCWDSLYEIHQWSNVICVHRRDKWYPVLEKYKVTNGTAIQELIRLGAQDSVYSSDDKGINHTCHI